MKTVFSQYRALRKEIERLDRRLEILPKGEVVDYGIDYSTGYGRTIILRGIADEAPRYRLRELLEDRRSRAEEMIIEVEKAISACPEARTRNVLEAYYVEGKTLKEIAIEEEIHEDTVSEIKEKFFKLC